MNQHDVMTLEEVAELLRCSSRHLQNIRKVHGFPTPVVLGKMTVRYLRRDIEQFILGGGLQEGSKA